MEFSYYTKLQNVRSARTDHTGCRSPGWCHPCPRAPHTRRWWIASQCRHVGTWQCSRLCSLVGAWLLLPPLPHLGRGTCRAASANRAVRWSGAFRRGFHEQPNPAFSLILLLILHIILYEELKLWLVLYKNFYLYFTKSKNINKNWNSAKIKCDIAFILRPIKNVYKTIRYANCFIKIEILTPW